jgi:hypothetical protein
MSYRNVKSEKGRTIHFHLRLLVLVFKTSRLRTVAAVAGVDGAGTGEGGSTAELVINSTGSSEVGECWGAGTCAGARSGGRRTG